MINILFVSGIPYMGGTETVMYNIYNTIDKNEFSIDFMFLGYEKEDHYSNFSESVRSRSQIYYIPLLRDGIRENHSAIKKVFCGKKYDIVHSHINESGMDILRIARKCGITVRVAHSHNTKNHKKINTIKEALHKVYLDCARKMLPFYATHFIGCSELAGKDLFGERICNQKNYITFKNAIDIDNYIFKPKIREEIKRKMGLSGKKVVGHVGRFDYQKNHTYIIRIFYELYKNDKNVVLVLIGEGEEFTSIKELVKNLGLEDAVLLLGRRMDVNEILQVFDVFLLPSHYEGLSVALMEAQASGLPCLVSDKTTKEANISGDVEFMDINLPPGLWAERLKEILEETAIIDRRKNISRMRSAGFDRKTNILVLERFYRDALQENPRD